MVANIDFKEHEKLLRHYARRAGRRLFAAGVRSVEHEDIFQEMVAAWCKARDNFNPNLGVPFAPYLTLGIRNHINRWLQNHINQFQLAPFELDRPHNDDHEATLHDVTADPTVDAADEVVCRANFRKLLDMRLSKDARLFIEILENPPKELVEVLNGLKARQAYAKERGVQASAVTSRINATLVYEFMNFPHQKRTAINREIAEAIAEMHDIETI